MMNIDTWDPPVPVGAGVNHVFVEAAQAQGRYGTSALSTGKPAVRTDRPREWRTAALDIR
jgi:hypothetical protein